MDLANGVMLKPISNGAEAALVAIATSERLWGEQSSNRSPQA
jgi:hypothetical protein